MRRLSTGKGFAPSDARILARPGGLPIRPALGFLALLLPTLALPAPLEIERARPPRKVVQLTGDFDRQLQAPTLSRTETRAGVHATDLGHPFLHKGRLCFLFGDTWGRPGDLDSLAFAAPSPPGELRLDFVLAEDGRFAPLAPPSLLHGAFCVPSAGISIDGSLFVAYTNDVAGVHMRSSWLVRSEDDGRTWETLYPLSTDDPQTPECEARFVNTAFAVDGAGTLWMWGSGEYRRSSLCLARSTPAAIADPAAWRYHAGTASDGAVVWVDSERDAVPLFQHDQVGEFSCAWIAPLGRWILLYNSMAPRGVILRSAPEPWGPWSDPMVLFDPGADGGYGAFMHVANGADGLSDPGREHEWGGEYGPYLIPGLATQQPDGTCTLVFTLSTWNPYQVVVMEAPVRLTSGAP